MFFQFDQAISIVGVIGLAAVVVNGVFAPLDHISNGRRAWGKVGRPDICLFFAANNTWMVLPVTAMEANNLIGWCSSEASVAHPTLAKSWQVAVGSGKWEEQASVVTSILVS